MSHLENTLKQRRLSGLMQTLDVRLQEAVANRLGHAEFLELICQDELNVRQQRQMARRTNVADFSGLKTLEDFDWSFNPAIHRKEIFYPASQGRSLVSATASKIVHTIALDSYEQSISFGATGES